MKMAATLTILLVVVVARPAIAILHLSETIVTSATGEIAWFRGTIFWDKIVALASLGSVLLEGPPKHSDEKRAWIQAGNVVAYILFTLICAFIYDKVRKNYKYPQPKPDIEPDDDFTYGLFGCYSDPKLSLMACCCPALRWADSMDKAATPAKSLISYWPGVLLVLGFTLVNMMLSFALLHVFCGFCLHIVFVLVMVFFRQKLRRRYQIKGGSFRTFAADMIGWLCCPCCSIVQEAREVEQSLAA